MSRRRISAYQSLASLGRRIAAPAAIGCALLAPRIAEAAGLTGPVTGWASGVPSYISMYEYVPTNVVASPPIVVAAHYCGGSASSFYNMASGIVAAADRYGFIMIFPQTTNAAAAAKCWDVGSKASLTHDGGGDTQAIAQMVQYEVTNRNADASRVYAMGVSSGAMLTEALLAVYPDVFKAGSEFSGVPAGCWAEGWSASGNWSNTCSTGQAIKTDQQWGDLVRAMDPGFTGTRPRIQLWHGTADSTINYENQTEAIKEWTNVLGLSGTPTSVDTTSVSGFEMDKWQDACGFTLLEAHTQNGGGHTTPIDANSVIGFFGLDKTGADPQVPCIGGTDPGSGGATGSGGTANATGGATDSGGTSASGGNTAGSFGEGGDPSSAGGTASDTPQSVGSAGDSSAGATGSAGSATGAGDASAVGGAPEGGAANTSGRSGTAGSTASMGGRATGAGGSATDAGGTLGSGGVTASAGAAGFEHHPTGENGCGCNVVGQNQPTGSLAGLSLGLIGVVLGCRRRRI